MKQKINNTFPFKPRHMKPKVTGERNWNTIPKTPKSCEKFGQGASSPLA